MSGRDRWLTLTKSDKCRCDWKLEGWCFNRIGRDQTSYRGTFIRLSLQVPTACILTQRSFGSDRLAAMPFHELKLIVDATFKAYHEETSHRIRKLEAALQYVSSEQAIHLDESRPSKVPVDHGYEAAQQYAVPFESSKRRVYIPHYTTGDLASSALLHSPFAPVYEFVGYPEDMEFCDAMHSPVRPIFLLPNSALIINDFAGGRGSSLGGRLLDTIQRGALSAERILTMTTTYSWGLAEVDSHHMLPPVLVAAVRMVLARAHLRRVRLSLF